MQPSALQGDASVSVLLSSLPAYQRWQNRPLSAQLRQVLRNANEQELMSLAAAAMQRIVDEAPAGTIVC